MKKNIQVILFIFIILFFIGEVFLRIFYHEQLKTNYIPLIYQHDSLIGYRFIPNCTSKICIPSISKKFQLNNHGFYGPDFSETKPDSIFRIAVVGNSITEGIWLNGKENYTIMLQNIFESNGYKNVEVINCAIGGVNRDIRNYEHIYYNVSKFNPDIVLFNTWVIFFEENEIRENYKGYVLRHTGTAVSRQYAINGVERVEKMRIFKLFYDFSYIFRAFCKQHYENFISEFAADIRIYREKNSSSPDIIPYQYSYNTTMKLLSKLRKELQYKGCKLIPFILNESQSFTDKMKDSGSEYISLDIMWDSSLSHKHDGHPNIDGHKLIAERLYERLIEQNLIPKSKIK